MPRVVEVEGGGQDRPAALRDGEGGRETISGARGARGGSGASACGGSGGSDGRGRGGFWSRSEAAPTLLSAWSSRLKM